MTHRFERMLEHLDHTGVEIEEVFGLAYERLEAEIGHLDLAQKRLGSAAPHVPKLDLREYIAETVEPPLAVHRRLPANGDAWLNTTLSDCGEAMVINAIRAFHTEAGTPVPPFTDADAEKFYEIVGGYNPNAPLDANGMNPTDQGTDNAVLVREWEHPGILCSADGSRHTIDASVFVDPKDEYVTKIAIWEFVVNFRAYGLPETAQSQNGQWTVMDNAPSGATELGSWGYHDIAQTSYGPKNIGFPTWGMPWMATWEFDKRYAVQGFVVVTPEQRNLRGVSPAGIDWTKLNADLAKLPGGPND